MNDLSLDAVIVTPETGSGPFTHQDKEIGAQLREFWSWSCSDLLSNAMRGVLAEYIVGLALSSVAGTRPEWDAADLKTPAGLRVEVKSSAYLQSWRQQRLSTISFDIKPTEGWDHATNTYSTGRRRQADVYVFCVFKHTDKTTADPLNLDQWDFYVLSTDVLNNAVGEQQRITLSSLQKHRPTKASFGDLRAQIEAAYHQYQ